jgi:hypothetical protein
MWTWLRLGVGRLLLLATLLATLNLAAMSYVRDTTGAARTPQYASLGGLRAWRLAYEPPRSSGLLEHTYAPDTQSLLHWSLGGSSARASLWRARSSLAVREPHERIGTPQSVWVAIGLGLADNACWHVTRQAGTKHLPTERTQLFLGEAKTCWNLAGSRDAAVLTPHVAPRSHSDQTSAEQASHRLQREMSVLAEGQPVIVLSPALAQRTLGDDWASGATNVWIGEGEVPAANSPAEQNLATGTPPLDLAPASLAGLTARGWQIHAIRRAVSEVEVLAARTRTRWLWGMVALGAAVGALSAYGYRRVLSMMVAIRRTGGARFSSYAMDSAQLAASVCTVVVAGSTCLLAVQTLCGGACGAPQSQMLMPMQLLTESAVDTLRWMLWPWLGFVAGVVTTLGAIIAGASKQGLQHLFARGAAG